MNSTQQMPSSSQSIRLPHSRQKKKLKLAPTPALTQQAELNQAAHKWCEAKFDKLHQDHLALKAPAPPHPTDLLIAADDDDDEETEDQEPPLDINIPQGDGNDHQEAPVARNIGEFVAGRTYKSRRVKEERAWERVMQPMFVTWMRCSTSTSNWGHYDDWRRDYFENTSCYCPENAKVLRKVDMVDFVGKKNLYV